MLNIADLHVWAKYTSAGAKYDLGEPEEVCLSSWGTTGSGEDLGDPDTVTYSDFYYKSTDGTSEEFANAQYATIGGTYGTSYSFAGKFIEVATGVYYVPIFNVTYSYFKHMANNGTTEVGGKYICNGARKVNISDDGEYRTCKGLSYVSAINRSTYPVNGSSGGYLYVYQGQIGNMGTRPL